MGYVGNEPSVNFTSFAKQDITGNGGADYTLTHAVANANEIEVYVNNVRQEPTSAYSVSGTALTMTGNVASSDDFYVIYLGKALQTTVPPDGSVTNAKIANTTIDLTSKVTGVLPVANSQTNTSVMFHAYHTSVANQAGVLTGLNNENSFIYKGDLTSINTNTVYNTSNGRFTPGVAGKYWCYATMSPASATSGFERTIVRFLKNGTKYPASTSEFDTSFSQDSAEPTFLPCHISMIVDLSATDYLECQVFHDCESVFWEFKSNNCHFGGYKLIGT